MENNLSGEIQEQRELLPPRLSPIAIDPTKEQVQVSTLGHKGHGKTTLTAAITRVLAKANHIDTYATVDQIERGLDERAFGLEVRYRHNNGCTASYNVQ
jgi:translation elongation factor EF-Tu-like GTPase